LSTNWYSVSHTLPRGIKKFAFTHSNLFDFNKSQYKQYPHNFDEHF